MQFYVCFPIYSQNDACDIIFYVHQWENGSGAGLTSQLTTTQLGDLHVVEGVLHCSGAPGPVVTSERSERGPNYPHKNEKKEQKQFNTTGEKKKNHITLFKSYLVREG